MRSHTLTIDGYTMHTLDAGHGTPVLLMHGFAGSAEEWRPTVARLAAAGYRAIAVDNLGFGRSAKPADAPYSLQLSARLHAGILDALALSGAHVVAHSMGGKYALALALLHPERVGSLVLADSDGFVEPSPFTRLGGWPLLGDALLWISARPAMVRTLLGAAFFNPAQELSPALLARARESLSGAANRGALTALSRRYNATDLRRTGLRARLGELRAPILLVWGEQDRVFPLDPVGRTAAIELPNATLAVVPRCGHFPQIECPRQFQGLLLGWLARR
jgi:pimeloyl-ACP methyl ester carboxylesterase